MTYSDLINQLRSLPTDRKCVEISHSELWGIFEREYPRLVDGAFYATAYDRHFEENFLKELKRDYFIVHYQNLGMYQICKGKI